jgi:hypothetical protein
MDAMTAAADVRAVALCVAARSASLRAPTPATMPEPCSCSVKPIFGFRKAGTLVDPKPGGQVGEWGLLSESDARVLRSCCGAKDHHDQPARLTARADFL